MNDARRVTAQGNPITLEGTEVKVGETAPDFTALKNDLSPFNLSSLKGKPVMIVSVLSLDTSICDLEARRFNEEASKISDDLEIVVISMDLPFAQARWCGAAGADNITVVSDHRDASFGLRYGLLIKELRLLTRAIILVDSNGLIRYSQLCPETAQEPDYEEALEAVRAL